MLRQILIVLDFSHLSLISVTCPVSVTSTHSGAEVLLALRVFQGKRPDKCYSDLPFSIFQLDTIFQKTRLLL